MDDLMVALATRQSFLILKFVLFQLFEDKYSVSQSHEVQQVYTPGRGARPCAPKNVLHLLGKGASTFAINIII
jgi:hypothetical protein